MNLTIPDPPVYDKAVSVNNTYRWGVGVRSLLQAARVSQSMLAHELNLTPAALSFYLDGKRKVVPETVAAVNQSVARLVGVPDAQNYLAALALQDRLLPSVSDNFSFDGTFALLDSLNHHFVGGIDAAIREAFAGVDDATVRFGQTFLKLAAMRGKRLCDTLAGGKQRDLYIDQVLAVFRDHSLPLDRWLRNDYAAIKLRARDRFAEKVRIELENMLRDSQVWIASPKRSEFVDQIVDLYDGTFASDPTKNPLAELRPAIGNRTSLMKSPTKTVSKSKKKRRI